MCVPKAVELGVPLWLIKRVLEMVPSQNMRRMMAISDTMARRSLEIITEKKTALLKGDDALVHQVGEGKDIMSLLRAYSAARGVPDSLSRSFEKLFQ